MAFVEKARHKKASGMKLERAVSQAVEECISEGILPELFREHKKEIVEMGIYEFEKVSDLGFLILGEQQIDIRMLHDIASLPQLNAIAFLVRKLINQVNPLERYQKLAMGCRKQVAQSRSG